MIAHMVSDILMWLSNLFSNWQNWASGGGLGGVVTLVVYLVERLWGRTMSKLWYVLIFVVVFTLGASFMAWRDEHQSVLYKGEQIGNLKTEIEGLKIPKLNGTITNIVVAPAGNQDESSVVFVLAIITNTGLPSIVKDFILTVKMGDRKIRGMPLAISDKFNLWKRTEKEGEGLILKAEDYLPKKGMGQPIVRGGGIAGFIHYLIPNISQKQVISDGLIILSFKDVSDKDYDTQYDPKTDKDEKGSMMFIDPNKLQKKR